MGNAKIARKKRRLRKLRRIGLAIVGVVFIGWIFYLGATWGPRPVDSGPARTTDPASRVLVDESLELERQFEAIAAYRTPTVEELDLLRRALGLQREHNLSRRPSSSDRRRGEELEQRLGYFLAKEIHEKSLEAERESEVLLAEGELIDAVDKVREAFDLQRKVNIEFGRGEFGDRMREARLEQQLASMEAAPLHERSLELEAEADVAIAEFNWEDARALLTEARQLQERINGAPRRSAYYNSGRIRTLDEKMNSLRVGEKMSEVEKLAAEGRALEENRQWEKAAQAYERAMVLQNEINRDHPQSPFVSREGAIALDAARQTALSRPQGQRLEQAIGALRTALRAGNFAVAAQTVEQAGDLAAEISERFSRSNYVTPELRLELGFLAMAEPALPELQNLLRDGLLPIPGMPGFEMSSTPVSQGLFSRIMNANPSRNRGDDLPVDSVTLRQAREFCRRASWILARPVQLPAKDQVEAALDEAWDAADSAVSSWHSENSDGQTHPVQTGTPNVHGFLHLTGNLRTWLNDAAEGESAWTAGLSYAEEFSQDELFRLISDSNSRAPTVGFRYVVGRVDGQ